MRGVVTLNVLSTSVWTLSDFASVVLDFVHFSFCFGHVRFFIEKDQKGQYLNTK